MFYVSEQIDFSHLVVTDTSDGSKEQYTIYQLQNFLDEGIDVVGFSPAAITVYPTAEEAYAHYRGDMLSPSKINYVANATYRPEHDSHVCSRKVSERYDLTFYKRDKFFQKASSSRLDSIWVSGIVFEEQFVMSALQDNVITYQSVLNRDAKSAVTLNPDYDFVKPEGVFDVFVSDYKGIVGYPFQCVLANYVNNVYSVKRTPDGATLSGNMYCLQRYYSEDFGCLYLSICSSGRHYTQRFDLVIDAMQKGSLNIVNGKIENNCFIYEGLDGTWSLDLSRLSAISGSGRETHKSRVDNARAKILDQGVKAVITETGVLKEFTISENYKDLAIPDNVVRTDYDSFYVKPLVNSIYLPASLEKVDTMSKSAYHYNVPNYPQGHKIKITCKNKDYKKLIGLAALVLLQNKDALKSDFVDLNFEDSNKDALLMFTCMYLIPTNASVEHRISLDFFCRALTDGEDFGIWSKVDMTTLEKFVQHCIVRRLSNFKFLETQKEYVVTSRDINRLEHILSWSGRSTIGTSTALLGNSDSKFWLKAYSCNKNRYTLLRSLQLLLGYGHDKGYFELNSTMGRYYKQVLDAVKKSMQMGFTIK